MNILDESRILDYTVDEKLLETYFKKMLASIDKNMDVFVEKFPHVSTGNKYEPKENRDWTSSFFVGMAYLAFHATKDDRFLRNSEVWLKGFNNRLENNIGLDNHDIGFLYTLSCVALYKLTDSEKAKLTAIKAADRLISRYNKRGKFIQAWGSIGVRYPNVKIIIDCMMNLPLLYWATEVTGDENYAEIAKKHAMTSSHTLVREDASVYHTYMFDPISGRAIEGGTHQGKYDESTWARGQAWCVYGFTLSYIYTKDPLFLDIAIRSAEYYIDNLPKDYVHYWDFAVSELAPEMKDSSAASIGAAGLLELSKYVDEERARFFEKCAKIILQELCQGYFIDTNDSGYGLLREGFYSLKKYDEAMSWGDYFFVEAMCKLKNREKDLLFW